MNDAWIPFVTSRAMSSRPRSNVSAIERSNTGVDLDEVGEISEVQQSGKLIDRGRYPELGSTRRKLGDNGG
jgi:hypothetical protein